MTTMEIEVVDIRKIVGEGKIKAMADVKLADCLLVKGFCVMEGKNGIFVTMPRRLAKDGRWLDVVEPELSLKHQIAGRILESFDRELDGVKS